MCEQSAIDSSTIARCRALAGMEFWGKASVTLHSIALRGNIIVAVKSVAFIGGVGVGRFPSRSDLETVVQARSPGLRGFTQVALVIAQGVVDAGIGTQEQFDLATANCAVPHFHDQSPGGSQTQKLPKNSTSSQEQGFAVARCCARLIKHEIFVLRRLSVKRRSINRIIAI